MTPKTNEWEETLQVEVMEDYLFTATHQFGRSDEDVKRELRGHYNKLVGFIYALLTRATAEAVEAERERIREWAKENGHQQEEDSIWCNMDELTKSLTGERSLTK